MRRHSRKAFVTVALGSLLLACSTRKGPKNASNRFELLGTPMRSGLDNVLVFLPPSPGVQTTYEALRDEMGEDFNVVPQFIGADDPDAFNRAIEEYKPKCLVLFDNSVLRGYRRYRDKFTSNKVIPGVVLLTSFVEDFATGMPELTGVIFEVPVATSASVMRSIIASPVVRVGVVHRQAFSGYVERQKELANIERLAVLPASVGDKPSAKEVRKAVYQLRDQEKVDTFWVLNDNGLLTPDFIQDVWRPEVTDKGVASIVGLDVLVSPANPFGTFAVVPDQEALGVQAANIVYDLSDANWVLVESRFQQPLSVKTIIDTKRARADLGLREKMVDEYSVELK